MNHQNKYQWQAEENLFSKFEYLPSQLGYNVENNEYLCRIDSEYNSSMFNIVCRTKIGKTEADIVNQKNFLQDIIDLYQGRPFAWWLGPSCCGEDLKKDLIESGFTEETTEYAMIANLSNYQPQNLEKKEFDIKLCEDIQQLEDFASVISIYDQNAEEFYVNSKILSKEIIARNPLFICYSDNKPVATGALHFTNKMAGVFDLITIPDMQGKGIGTAMMHKMMGYAKDIGCKQACLAASSDSGYRIYERLGFETVGKYNCYEWSGK